MTARRKTTGRRAGGAAARRLRKLDSSHVLCVLAGTALGWAVAAYGLRTVASTTATVAFAVVGGLVLFNVARKGRW